MIQISRSFIFAMLVFTMSGCGNENKSSTLNTKASLPDSLAIDFTELKVITSMINKQSQTMSTLYGSPPALERAKSLNEKLGPDERFVLVTWKQQSDDHWFGANIPGDLHSVEVVEAMLANNETIWNYKKYEGQSLVLVEASQDKNERIKFIIEQRASIMP